MKIWGIILFTLLLIACSNIFEPPIDTGMSTVGYGKVRLQLTDSDARTVFPSFTFTDYVYDFSEDGGASWETMSPNEDDPLTFTLEEGTWRVKVSAYIEEKLAASGESEEFDIDPSSYEEVRISLKATDEENGEGIFSYYIQSPLGSTIEYFTLTNLLTDTTETLVKTGNENGGAFIFSGETELSAGFYLLNIRLFVDESYAGISTAVHIYRYMTTEFGKITAPIVFQDNVFSRLLPLSAGDFDLTDNHKTYDGLSEDATVSYIDEYMDTTAGIITAVHYSGTGNTDYEENTTPPVNAGTYEVKVTTTVGSVYARADRLTIGTLTIDQKPLTITGVTAVDRVYEPDNTTVNLTGGALAGIVDGDAVNFTLGVGTIADANADSGKPVTTNIQLTGTDSGNYILTQPTDVIVTINKAPGTFSDHPAIDTTYTSTLKLADLTLLENYAWVTSQTLLSAGDGQTFPATYTDPSGNYEAADGSITVNIARAAGAPVDEPTRQTRTQNSITIYAVTAPLGQTVEYAISTTDVAPSTDWQDETTFTSLADGTALTEGTDYYIFARSKANENYLAGESSMVQISTTKAGDVGIVFYWVNERDNISFTPNSVTVSKGESFDIDPQSNGYSGQQWFVNGVSDTRFTDKESYTFSTEGRETGRNYTVTLFVMKDGKYYSADFVVTVIE